MTGLAGTRLMLGLTLRRERVRGSASYLLTAVLLLLVAAGVAATYPTAGDREALAGSVNASAGELFIIGPVTSTDLGGVGLWRTQGIATIFISLVSVFLVLRNTRAAEESGASEMLGSAAVGRTAPLGAALGAGVLGSVAAGIVVAAGFVGIGASTPGSLLVGAQIIVLGLLAASLAAVTGQIMQTARGATGVAVVFVAVFFLLRGAADVLGGSAYWMSPFGWIADVRPFADDNAVMLLPAIALAAVLTTIAIQIASRRDLGAGAFPERVGPAHAGAALRGPVSLALRISRGTIVGWAVGALLVGALIGAVASTVDTQAVLALGDTAGNGSGLVQVALYLSPLLAAILGVQTTARLRGEVTSGRVEAILSRPVTRARWLLAHTVTGSLGATVTLVAFGLGLGAAQLGTDPASFGTLVAAAALRSPAAWVFTALAALLLATVPRAAAAASFIVVGAFQVLEFAVEFHLLPHGALLISPFALVPQLPHGDPHPGQVVLLTVAATVIAATATRTVRHQDVH